MDANPKKSFSTSVDVIFRDIDVLGHVNNAVYFTYMEIARTKFFMERLGLTNPAELPFILAHASCNYRSAAQFGERLIVTVFVARIGDKSFDLRYLISSSSGRLVAEGTTVMVTFDYTTRSSIKVPKEIRTILTEYLEHPSEN